MFPITFKNATVFLAAGSLLIGGAHAQEQRVSSPAARAASPFPLQLEVVVPHEPTAFLSGGQQVLVYELVLRNFEREAVDVHELAVLDADANEAEPFVVLDAEQLRPMMRAIGPRPPEGSSVTTLAGGASAFVYLLLSFDSRDEVPLRLRHRLRTSRGDLTAAAIGTHHDVLQVLGPPVRGGGWLAETGLSNDNGHRRGNLLLAGQSRISRRYAFDWMQVEDGATYAGDQNANASYFGYGEPVVAVADGVVESIVDGIAENIPGRRPAIAITYETVPGNRVTLDIGNGQYAHYMHLQPGSIPVRAGDRVRRGDVLGRVGNAGDSFAPHLHFEITTSPAALAGEGVPYVLESFQAAHPERGAAVQHRQELPREKMLVSFDE